MPQAVIIGSGFGGAVTALRLMQAKDAYERLHREELKLILLERGRRYAPEDFPRVKVPESWTNDPDLQTSKRLPDFTRVAWKTDQGLWDLRNLDRLQVAQAAGYGGGSLVYASVHLRPPEDVFAEWPRHPKAGTLTWLELLEPYYHKVAKEIGLQEAPANWQKTRAFDKTVEQLGRKSFSPPLAISFGEGVKHAGEARPSCTGCGNCTSGCAVGAKNTLDKNYLRKAEEAGLEVRTLAEVTLIERCGEAQYRVKYLDHFCGSVPKELDAHYVFLCAGALNSTEILMRSRDRLFKHALSEEPHARARLPLLGKRFWANGDSIGVLFDTEPQWDAATGPTITRAVYHREPKQDGNTEWFLIQDGGIPRGLRRAIGAFRSPLWLGRSGYAAPSARRARPVRRSLRIMPNEEIDALVAQIPNLFQARARFRPKELQPGQVEIDFWKRALPKPLVALFSNFLDVEGTVRKEVSFLNESVLAEIGAAFQGGTLLRILTPLFRDFLDLDVLTTVTLRVLKERLGRFGTVLQAKNVAQLLFALGQSIVLGEDPGTGLGILLAMGPDDGWTLELAGQRLRVRKKERPDKRKMFKRYDTQERLMRDIAAAAGARLYTNPRWTIGQRPITVHAQGGCCMGDDASDAVTKPTGEVRELPNLFVFDGAVMPTSVGVNPSHTIAALAELNVETFICDKLKVPLTRARVEDMGNVPKAYGSRDLPSDAEAARTSILKASQSISWDERMDGFLARKTDLPTRTFGKQFDLNQACYLDGLRRGVGLQVRLRAKVPSVADALISDEPVVIALAGDCTLRLDPNKPHIDYDAQGTLTVKFSGVTGAMDYHLKFLENAKLRYELDGHKELKEDPGFDAWADLTTLFVQLRPSNPNEPIWFGVLHLHLDDFLKIQLPSFTAANRDDEMDDMTNAQQAWVLARFADFFFRKVRRVYDPGVA